MKAWQINKFGKVENVLQLAEIPVPFLGGDDVLVEVHAIGMNPIDYRTIQGQPEIKTLMSPKFPFTVGIDLSGVVAKVGQGVTSFKPGDEVFAKMPVTGGAFSQFVATKESWLARKPRTLSHQQAASIPLVALTTWQSLIDVAKLSKGQKVFIPAGSGGIGTFAIQLAKYLGATVATTTSSGNMDLVKSLGADIAIDYKSQNFRDILKDFDVVYDTLGGKSLEDSLYILKRGGIVVTIVGIPDEDFIREQNVKWYFRPLLALLNMKIKRLSRRMGVRYKFVLSQSIGSELAEVSKLIDQNTIRPVIDQVFPFDKTKEALLYLQKGRARGKVVATLR